MRVFIVEPSAITIDRTHAGKSILGHSRVLQSANIDVEWITNSKSSLHLEGISNHRTFDYTIYDDVRSGYSMVIRWMRFIYYRRLVQDTYNKLREVLERQHVSEADHLFVPTTDWIILKCIYRLMKDSNFKHSTPKLHILVMYEKANWMTGGYPYKKIMGLLQEIESPLFIYTESERHARRLSATIGKHVSSYPFPCFVEKTMPAGSKKNHKVCFLGGGRKDKGYSLIPGIIRKCEKKDSARDIKFLVQSPRPEDGLGIEIKALRKFNSVAVLENRISESDYRNAILGCSILVFPYQQNIYYVRGSAIVNEAVANGIPIVCTANTSLEEMLSEENGIGATGEQEFANAIAKILSSYEEYSENATKMASAYQDNLLNSAFIRNINSTPAT